MLHNDKQYIDKDVIGDYNGPGNPGGGGGGTGGGSGDPGGGGGDSGGGDGSGGGDDGSGDGGGVGIGGDGGSGDSGGGGGGNPCLPGYHLGSDGGCYLDGGSGGGGGGGGPKWQWDPGPKIELSTPSGFARVDASATANDNFEIWPLNTPIKDAYPSVTISPGQTITISAASANDVDYKVYKDKHTESVGDVVDYIWTADDGAPQAQTDKGGSFTWKAPELPAGQHGHVYHVSFKAHDVKPHEMQGNENGSRDDDPTDKFTFEVRTADHPHPENMRVVSSQVDNVNGILAFAYFIGSTSGGNGTATIRDGYIKMREVVKYDVAGSELKVSLPSPPYAAGKNDDGSWANFHNPLIRGFTLDNGDNHDAADQQGHGNFAGGLVKHQFTGTQTYAFHCDKCMKEGEYQPLFGPVSIKRYVESGDYGWRYRITKHDKEATMPLAPKAQ